MRMTIGQVKHKPCVVVYDTETRKEEKVFIPIENDVFDIEEVEKEKYKEEKMRIYIEAMNEDYEVGTYFEKSIRNFLDYNEIEEGVRKAILMAVGEGG